MTALIFTVAGFLSGSLMFSAWIARYILGRDLAAVGDGNPGSTNLLKAGGFAWGGLAFILEICKGAVPVGLARYTVGITGWELVPIAIAPVVGHAFSPWLGFKGGKAMAVTFGIWIGLTLWMLPAIGLPILVIAVLLLDNSGWAVVILFSAGAVVLLIMGEPILLAVLILNAAIVIYKYRADLYRRPGLRRWARRVLGQTAA
ncbi:MAG: glycerol-3-phosphate acyltransferase [Anaerolinea sp.]|nr:glycerol-3-phosphate acyltransferase [Anaerolinea sp.]